MHGNEYINKITHIYNTYLRARENRRMYARDIYVTLSQGSFVVFFETRFFRYSCKSLFSLDSSVCSLKIHVSVKYDVRDAVKNNVWFNYFYYFNKPRYRKLQTTYRHATRARASNRTINFNYFVILTIILHRLTIYNVNTLFICNILIKSNRPTTLYT